MALLAGTFGLMGASISGTVTDPAGIGVPDARVNVLNQGTNASVLVRTSPSGRYSASDLAAGKYTVVIDKEGFRPFRRVNIVVGAEQIVRINASLAPASAGQTTSRRRDRTQ